MTLGIACVYVARSGWSKRTMGLWYIAFTLGWLLMVRTHPAYPPMTEPLKIALDPDWADRTYQQ